MATEAATIEAARTRIQRLVEQIAALGKAEISSEEFFFKFLERVTSAIDAKGGALWLVGSRPQDNKTHFQLCAQVDLPSSRFGSDEIQRATLLKILAEVVRTNKPLTLIPAATDPAPPPGPVNTTPFPFLHIPLHLNNQAIGVLQVWLQPSVQPRSFPEFVTFLTSLTPCVEQHLQSRRPANLLVETQRLHDLLRFTTDLAGVLDPLRIARLTAHYARDLAGCERATFLSKEHDTWKVLAISGRETIPAGDSAPAFVLAHVAQETRVLEKNELPQSAAPPHILSAVICPILNAGKEVAGAIFCESTFESYFDASGGNSELPPARRIVERVAAHAGRALAAARQSQPLPVVQWISEKAALLNDHNAWQRLLNPGLCVLIPALILLYPARRHVEGDCSIQALHRAIVAPRITARIDTILVREGDHVVKGQVLARLDTGRLTLPADLESATLRSPIDGVVMTRDLELRAGQMLKEGRPFAEIDDLASWQLHTEINERDIAGVEEALQKKGALDLTYILESQSTRLHARIDSPQQISPSSDHRDNQNVFLVTIDNPPMPADIANDLRPGFTGRAQIELGRRPLLFIIAGNLYRWCQLRMIG
jgi:multidrug efflux pump subunit AcrA (membrane-fusion protein)